MENFEGTAASSWTDQEIAGLGVGWSRPVVDGLHLRRIHGYALL